MILALVDINDLKGTHEKLVDYVTAMVDTVRAPLMVLRPDLCVNMANEAFYQMFQTSRLETENHLLYELGSRQWDIPELRHLLLEISSGDSRSRILKLRRIFRRSAAAQCC